MCWLDKILTNVRFNVGKGKRNNIEFRFAAGPRSSRVRDVKSVPNSVCGREFLLATKVRSVSVIWREEREDFVDNQN